MLQCWHHLGFGHRSGHLQLEHCMLLLRLDLVDWWVKVLLGSCFQCGARWRDQILGFVSCLSSCCSVATDLNLCRKGLTKWMKIVAEWLGACAVLYDLKVVFLNPVRTSVLQPRARYLICGVFYGLFILTLRFVVVPIFSAASHPNITAFQVKMNLTFIQHRSVVTSQFPCSRVQRNAIEASYKRTFRLDLGKLWLNLTKFLVIFIFN